MSRRRYSLKTAAERLERTDRRLGNPSWLGTYGSSLRLLVLLITAACGWLALEANRAQQLRRAVQAIEERGGAVSFDFQFDRGGGFLGNRTHPLRKLVGGHFHADIAHVTFRNPDRILDDAQLAELRPLLESMPKLEVLLLDPHRITDQGLQELYGLKNLEHLMLHNDSRLARSGISEAGFRRLKDVLPNCTISQRD